MKSPYKSSIVTSDWPNYQVTLTLIHKRLFIIIKANVPSVAHQFSRSHAQLHTAAMHAAG